MVPLRFEVTVNGRVLCTAGMDCDGVLMVTVQAENMPLCEDGSSMRGTPGGKLHQVSIDGLTSLDETLEWPNAQIRPGDEIRIRVLPTGEFDPPTLVKYDIGQE